MPIQISHDILVNIHDNKVTVFTRMQVAVFPLNLAHKYVRLS